MIQTTKILDSLAQILIKHGYRVLRPEPAYEVLKDELSNRAWNHLITMYHRIALRGETHRITAKPLTAVGEFKEFERHELLTISEFIHDFFNDNQFFYQQRGLGPKTIEEINDVIVDYKISIGDLGYMDEIDPDFLF